MASRAGMARLRRRDGDGVHGSGVAGDRDGGKHRRSETIEGPRDYTQAERKENMKRYKTRDPQPTTRDPEIDTNRDERRPRRFIPASMPVVCPDCGHSTRMDDGRHVDPVRKTILEYRTCGHCGAKLAAGRAMTPRECETLCGRAEAVAEYEESVRISGN
jgi:hypothetical protein